MARAKMKAKAGVVTRTVRTTTTEYLGICSTCNHAPDCAHRIRNANTPIWDCENYDDHVSLSGVEFNGGLSEILPKPRKSRRAEFDAIEYKGLCRNCENRDTCNIARPAGGVWNCEEYC
jgi:hypothetical protein